jgi:hypothetical protein
MTATSTLCGRIAGRRPSVERGSINILCFCRRSATSRKYHKRQHRKIYRISLKCSRRSRRLNTALDSLSCRFGLRLALMHTLTGCALSVARRAQMLSSVQSVTVESKRRAEKRSVFRRFAFARLGDCHRLGAVPSNNPVGGTARSPHEQSANRRRKSLRDWAGNPQGWKNVVRPSRPRFERYLRMRHFS